MQLMAGERLSIENGQCLHIISGKLEVYALPLQEASFRQIYLMELTAGDWVYGLGEQVEAVCLSVYAETDLEYELHPLSVGIAVPYLSPLRKWFHQLFQLSWLKVLKEYGDDTLQKWEMGKLFLEIPQEDQQFRDVYLSNADIFAAMLEIRCAAADVRFQKQLALGQLHHRRLLDESVANLLGEEALLPVTESADRGLEDVAFVVGKVAAFWEIAAEKLTLPNGILRKLDQLGVLRRLMGKAGMQMRLVRLEEDWYRKDSGPVVAFYGPGKELAALIPKSPGDYILYTRKSPGGIPLTEGEAAKLDGDAFQCYADLPARSLKPGDFGKYIFRRLWKDDMHTVLWASLIAGVVATVMPLVTETVFSDILPIYDYQSLATVTQIAIVSAFITMLVTVVRSIAMLRLSVNSDMVADAALVARLFALPAKFFRRFQSGELAGRVMAIRAIRDILRGGVLEGVFNLIFSFWSLALMCYYSLKLTAIAIALWLLYMLLLAFISRNYLDYSRKEVGAANATSGILQQIFAGLAKFRLHGAESQAFSLWSKAYAEEWKWNLALRWQTNYRTIAASVEPLIILIVIYYVMASDFAAAAAEGKDPYTSVISYAKFMAFQTAFVGLNATLMGFVPQAIALFSIKPHIENMAPILEEIPETTDDRMDAGVLRGSIQVEHLVFSYSPQSPPVLKDLSLSIKAGEHVAIVGRSGCGKSTFVRLLMGFEKPTRGAIYYDGQDLAELNPTSVRSQMGVVLQNGQLMTGDIYVNIVGTMALSMEDAWRAAEDAGIAEDIRNMPMGMHTAISEGSSNISGGQRQRILIARALAANPAIVIFDEATSALDNRTQAIVTESLAKRNTTRIVVAHRLSTIRDADRILVFDGGTIAESGTYDELMARDGIFAELVRRQVA